MAHVLRNFVFSKSFLVRLALLALSLSFGVPQAQSAYAKAPADQGANQYNWLAGGGG